ncbi:MAG: hypothetical protein L6Q57_03050 [Alphaproteobacteria bacterium]|nr:hypothetical protein [Alphaproteobacteria bacterium]
MLSFLNLQPRRKHYLPASTVFHIDATVPASYPGSGQTWTNIINAPSDGLAKSAYDFWIGRDNTANSEDLTFSSNKFISDGGDLAEIKSTTDFIRNQFRSDLTNSWWSAAAFLIASASASQTFYGSTNASSVPGWRIEANTTPLMRLVRSDGTQNLATSLHNITSFIGLPVLHVFTWNNGTRGYKSALNSRTFTVSGTAAETTQTAANTGKLNFGSANHGTQKMLSGSELYGFAMGTGPLTNADLSKIVDFFNSLHRRPYVV